MDELIELLLTLPSITAENRQKCLPMYEQFFQKLLKFNRKIASIWELLFQSKIKNDELLPITLALLPTDSKILTKIMDHADYASLATADSIVSFMLTNLYTAASAKKNELEDSDAESASENEQVSQVVAEYQRDILIHKLRTAANNYKEAIAEAMLIYIKNNEPFYYKRYMATGDTIGSEELNIMRFDMTMMADKPAIKLLNEKYILISDMIITLKRKKMQRENILIEFTKKYEQHKELFLSEDIKANHVPISKITRLFSQDKSPIQQAQEQFFAIADSLYAIPDLISMLRSKMANW